MTNTHVSRLRHAISMLLGLVLAVGSLTACQLSAGSEGAAYAENCPKHSKLATAVHLDVSGSFVTDQVDGQRLGIVRDAIGRTAACGGHLQIRAFAGSGAGTAVLYDDELHLKGSTETARLRRIPALIDSITKQVSEGYTNLPTMTGGTDVVGQLRGDQEYAAQLGSGYSLWSITATDGLQTAGVQWRKLTESGTAEAQAKGLALADLSGTNAEVLFVGIGNTTDSDAPPTAVVEAVKSFYRVICDRLAAKRCDVATDYTPIGG
ncbi:hypothetical protein GKE82_21010 [Conexibacter sp. W3-3-2]|uniref:hypothetical protein n=1 Tax=Conexibacter sp. W3-3-2 TaxID=2675227 RepID=UPI0012B7A425|nr:hypothetical protein [Conexibacter sp. W3-3-2]MTD46701.1 hypothetical protein [Conexibacter sp. W3-3-2]